ncbi:S9 family peptidase [Roseateles sp. BYS87W]|uniref:Alpha/beta fold hydrolase n=1 Tax=Pelomonas baiyunensis TaxID=3299026 RepID=A0ABW7GUI8_9BURK
MKIISTLLVALSATSAMTAALAQPAPTSPPALSLERLTADPPLAGRLPRQAEVSPGGQWVSYLRPSQADSEVLELWAQPAAGGAPRKLVAAADLLGGAAQRLTEAEKMALERLRISQRGITRYQWCGQDDRALLFPLSGDLFLVRLTDSGPQAQRLTQSPDAAKQDPRCSADARQLAYVQGGRLHVLSLQPGAQPRALVPARAETHISWGLAEFIAAEELGRHRGFWWSPNGTQLLALRVDESRVGLKTRAQIFADRTEMTQQRYPAAGEANAKVTAHVVQAATGATQALPLPADAEYIARAGWFADGTPWLQWFNRAQTRLTLTEFKRGPRGYLPHDITVETDAAWVEVHDDLLETPRGLLWSSEVSGRRQLLLLDRATGARTPLTQLNEPVGHAVCASDERVVFTAFNDRGRGQDLFSLPLAGGQPQPVAGSGGRQWREAKGDRACARLLVTRSAWGRPPQLELRGLADGSLTALAGDAPDPALRQYTNMPLLLELTSADGQTPLSAFFFPAQDRREGKHPVIVMAYGGPGAATVNWGWGRDMALIAYWQQRGFGVLTLDTRGMQHRDREFTRGHYRSFGRNEVADLFAAVRELPSRVPGVDAARIGFFGWSYGGFLGARAMLDADTPFAAAVAVAPVTDWTLYDTAYTERYLGLPEGGKAAAYADAHLPSRAALLSKPLLLVHGTADDNVLFDHTLRLVEALQNAGKPFDLQIYPGKAHGIAGRAARLHLYRTMDAFFERHLKAAP